MRFEEPYVLRLRDSACALECTLWHGETLEVAVELPRRKKASQTEGGRWSLTGWAQGAVVESSSPVIGVLLPSTIPAEPCGASGAPANCWWCTTWTTPTSIAPSAT